MSKIEKLIFDPKKYESKEQAERRKKIYERTKQASEIMERIKQASEKIKSERTMSYLDEKGNMHGPFVGSIDCSEIEGIKNFGGNVTATKIDDKWHFDMDSWPMHQDENGNWHPGHYKPKERPIKQIINEGIAIIKARDVEIKRLKKKIKKLMRE